MKSVLGLPVALQVLIDQVNAEQIDYRGRRDDAEQLENYLAAGNHSMAEFVVGQMIEHQQQYRHAQAHGLPAALHPGGDAFLVWGLVGLSLRDHA